MSRPTRSFLAPGHVDITKAEARASLCEALLAAQDATQCAQLVVSWLRTHAGIDQVMCALRDEDLSIPRLLGCAGAGVSSTHVRTFSLSLLDRTHPLSSALLTSKPQIFQGPRLDRIQGVAWSKSALVAQGVFGPEDGEVLGLLLCAPPAAWARPVLTWVTALFGQCLARLRDARLASARLEHLERERQILGAMLGAISDPIVLADTQGRPCPVNAQAEALFSASEDASEGRRRAVALNHMLFAAAFGAHDLNALAPQRRELALVDPSDGSELRFEITARHVASAQSASGTVIVLQNISELHRATAEIAENNRLLRVAEASLRAERDRLDLVIDSIADPILVTDPCGNVLMMNAPAERLFGETAAHPRAPEGNPIHDLNLSSFVSSLFFSGDEMKLRSELELTTRLSSEPLPVEAVAEKIVSERGEVTAIVTVLHDRREAIEKTTLCEQLERASSELEEKVREATTELIQQNELLRRQHLELEQASELKSQFLANMSHEFRTPLNAILGYTSMLLQGVGGEMSAQQKRMLSRVDSNSRHLLSIINDILDISRIEAGRMPLHLSSFRLEELIVEVITEVEPLITKSGLTVTADMAPELPVVTSDRHKVKQIVLNLLTNALKFTPSGTVRIECARAQKRRNVRVSIIDSGIGIAESDLAHIFDDFRQADSSPTRQYGGAGLGLAICKRLAAMLSGQMSLESKLGEGSAFSLIIPTRVRRR